MVYIPNESKHHQAITDYNGSQWSKEQVDAYNRHTDAVNQYAGCVIKTDSLLDKEREQSLNERYEYMSSVIDLNFNKSNG